jgi:hypothetical protein
MPWWRLCHRALLAQVRTPFSSESIQWKPILSPLSIAVTATIPMMALSPNSVLTAGPSWWKWRKLISQLILVNLHPRLTPVLPCISRRATSHYAAVADAAPRASKAAMPPRGSAPKATISDEVISISSEDDGAFVFHPTPEEP